MGVSNYPIGIAMSSLWNASIPGIKAVAIATDTYPNQAYRVATVGTPPDIIVVRAVPVLLAGFGGDLVLPEDQMLVPYHDRARKYFKEMGWLE